MRQSSKVYQAAYPSSVPTLPPTEPSLPEGMGNGLLDSSGEQKNKFQPPNIEELDDKINTQLLDFSGLLDTLSSVEDKQRALWKQIYENAVQDRRNAYLMWSDLYVFVSCNPTEHAIHGQNLSRYMERMSKANDQILKLSEMVSNATQEQIEETFTEEDMYNNIQKTTLSKGH